ncbi:ribosomal-protein-alanine N-acetyltransferase [Amorphus sp. MBR-141]
MTVPDMVSLADAAPADAARPGVAAIRRAVPADVPRLVALENAVFASDRLSQRSLRTLIARPSASVLVAESAGRLVGALVVLYRRSSRLARLYSLSVAPGMRGAGLGGLLLAAAEDDARGRGAGAMRLEVRSDNAGAIALYRRHGYRHIGNRESYYADGGDALRFGKTLSPS